MDEQKCHEDASANAHDAFVKTVLGKPEHACDFFRQHLPAEVVAHLDLTTLRPAKGSFVSKRLRQYFSDLVFHLQSTEGDPVGVYLLLEHKSAPHQQVALQILRYMMALWQRHLSGKNRTAPLPAVVPLILYHGKQSWEPKPLADLIALPAESFRAYVPQWRTEFCDVQRLNMGTLHHQLVLQAALLMLRHIFDPGMSGKLSTVLELLYRLEQSDDTMEYLEVFMRYAVSCADLAETDIEEAIQNIPSSMKEELMPTLASKWMDQGRQEGRAEGRVEGRAEGEQQGEIKLLKRLLTHKFKTLPAWLEERLNKATTHELEAWSDAILYAKTIEEVFASVPSTH